MTFKPITFHFVQPGHVVEHRPSGTVHRVEHSNPYIDRFAGLMLIARPPTKEVLPCVE
ncbi:hypothetical protein RA2_00581 [Roseovarius sp. A-2]|uniref:hypothetical protein n=1 Tax=Roseovarius sp. A-2 TaxID=1570360 RepID=UPI0009C89627|nr:hypothetical protein [Roseovarius sp. A-2]GAW33542.1 hypothetical protein RA2_00581 [Roseovarius sp. A-2]